MKYGKIMRILLIALCITIPALLLTSRWTPAISHQAGNARCLACHSFVTKTPADTLESRIFNYNDITELAHIRQNCSDCHDEKKYSSNHSGSVTPAAEINGLCVKCHGNVTHKTHKGSASKDLKCNDCHKVHNAFKKNLEYNNDYLVSKKCAGCHETESVEMKKCAHFDASRLSKGDVPYCSTCHGEHTGEIKLGAIGFRTNLPIKNDCTKCHTSLPYSASKKLETTSANLDFHGITGTGEARIVSKCSSCHLPHNSNDTLLKGLDTTPISVRKSGNLISDQCVSCHPGIDRNFSNPSIHSADASCMGCHGNKGFKVSYGLGTKDLYIDKITMRNSVHGNKLKCVDCHKGLASVPHKPEDIKKVDCESCHQYDQKSGGKTASAGYADWKMSAHYKNIEKGGGGPTCKTCHGTHDIFPAANPLSKINYSAITNTCGICHYKQKVEFDGSIHGEAAAKNKKDAPTCTTCHGGHLVMSAKDPKSAAAKSNIVKTCSGCHGSVQMMAKYNVDSTKVRDYKNSYHGFAADKNDLRAATCDSCHSAHDIKPSEDPKSSIHRSNLSKTCGKCHPGSNIMAGVGKIHWNKDDADYWIIKWISYFFIIVTILTFSMFGFYIVLDLNRWYKIEKAKHKLLHDGVGHEPGAAHGKKPKNKKAAENALPDKTTAPGALPAPGGEANEPALRAEAQVHTSFEPEIIVDTMQPEKFAEYNRTIPHHVRHKVKFLRWSESFRHQHVLLFTSSIILSITGLVQMFPNFFVSNFYFKYLISVPTNAIIHRFAAVGLITFCVWHLLFIVFTRNGRFEMEHFIPNLHDLYSAIEDWVSLFCGRQKKCKFDRYTYLEKFDYFAAYWGCVLMIVTGAIMWGHNIVVSFMPMITVDIAKVLHGYEAILELVATMVFHMYMTHFNPRFFPMKRTFLDGTSDYEEMKEYHEKELERIFPDEKHIK